MTRLSAAFILLACLCGCAPRVERPPAPVRPHRIVSLAPSVTEMLFAVGAGDRVVAADDYSNYPPEAKRLPRIGGISVNYEAVVALRPDLVIGVSDLQGASLRRIAALGLPVLSLDTTGYEKTIGAIRKLGTTVGQPGEAEAVARRLEDAKREVASSRRGVRAPSVLFVAEARPSLYVAGQGTFLDELIGLAGGQNAASISGFGMLSREYVTTHQPDLVLCSSDDAPALRAILGPRPRIAVPPRDILVRPGPRLGDGLKWLRREIVSVEARA